MSRKLATTIKDSAIPGKYKRVLEAYAAFANNDGTNIYPLQAKLGNKAGCSIDTIGRQTKELLVSTILRRAEKHTCKIKGCSGGSTHYCGYNGKWTNVYEIQLVNLQNAVNHLAAICGKARAAKCRKPSAAICGTDSGIKETPTPRSSELGTNPDSSSAHAADFSFFPSVNQGACAPDSANQEKDKTSTSSELESEEQTQTQEKTKTLIDDLGYNTAIPAMFGLPYFTVEHDLPRIAKALYNRNRSVSWLEGLVAWAKKGDPKDRESKFWKTKLQTGNAAVNKLAEFLEKGTIAEQYDSKLVASQGVDVFNALRENRYLHRTFPQPKPEPDYTKPIHVFANNPKSTFLGYEPEEEPEPGSMEAIMKSRSKAAVASFDPEEA